MSEQSKAPIRRIGAFPLVEREYSIMCQSSDEINVHVILHNEEWAEVRIEAELDGENFALDVRYSGPVSLRTALEQVGQVLDAQRLNPAFHERT